MGKKRGVYKKKIIPYRQVNAHSQTQEVIGQDEHQVKDQGSCRCPQEGGRSVEVDRLVQFPQDPDRAQKPIHTQSPAPCFDPGTLQQQRHSNDANHKCRGDGDAHLRRDQFIAANCQRQQSQGKEDKKTQEAI